MGFFSFLQPKTILEAACLFVTAAFFCGLSVSLFLFFGSSSEKQALPEEHIFYGRMQVLEAGGQKLEWDPIYHNNNAVETTQKRKSLARHLALGLGSASEVLHSLSVTEIHEDHFAKLFNAKNRGIYMSFELVAQVLPGVNVSEEQVKDNVFQALYRSSDIVANLDSLELFDHPIVEKLTFESLAAYLAGDRVTLDLFLTELPEVKRPSAVVGNVECVPILPPNHGIVYPTNCSLTKSKLNQVCTFACEERYTIVGANSISCLSTGYWSDIIPLCKAQCNGLDLKYSLSISPLSCLENGSLADKRCFFYCENGLVLDGSASRVCTDNGTWNGGLSICKESCVSLSIPDNGHVWPKSCTNDPLIPAGAVCSFSCQDGYSLVGSPSIHCDVDGTWNFPLPSCRRGCPTTLSPQHGTVFPELCAKQVHNDGDVQLVAEGVVCDYSCDNGYVLNGPEQRTCGFGGIWTGADAHCLRICPPLQLPYLMLASPEFCINPSESIKITEGLVCHLSCPSNYRASNDISDTICLTNGTWTTLPQQCLRTCPVLSGIANGMLLPKLCEGPLHPTEGTTCYISCMSGFQIRGIGSTVCLHSGKWSNPPGACLKRCPVLKALEHGELIPANCTISSFYQEEICHYKCHAGYALVGDELRICLSDGRWSSKPPTCKVQTQFMIRQSTADHDVCLDVNHITMYVEKTRITSCSLTNKAQIWNVMTSGLISNVEYRMCLTAEYADAGSFVMIEECDPSNTRQMWLWRDSQGLQISLENTNLEINYGYASEGNVMLKEINNSTNEKSIPWYAITTAGEHTTLDGLLTNVSCQRLRKPQYVDVYPLTCIENQTLPSYTECFFTCPYGRRLLGSVVRQCVNGMWTNSYPTCELTCNPLIFSIIGGGAIVPRNCSFERQNEYAVCQYQCTQSAYDLEGEDLTFCKGNGEWSSPAPQCVVHCPPLPKVDKGVVYPEDCLSKKMRMDSKCQLRCEYPYLPVGPPEAICLDSGIWSNMPFGCQLGCDFPNLVQSEDGVIECTKYIGLTTGDECSYSCGPLPYRALAYLNMTNGTYDVAASPGPNGNVTRECQSNGLFSGMPPLCISTCIPILLPQNGIFEPRECTTDVMIEGTVCHLVCDSGYGVRGERWVECQENGTWSEIVFYCEEETQFYIVNPYVSPSLIYLNVNHSGSSFEPDSYTIDRRPLQSSLHLNRSIWTWHSDHMLQHVYTGYCLAVADVNTLRSSILALRECSNMDLSQQWLSSYDNELFLLHFGLYLSYGDTQADYPLAIRHVRTVPSKTHEKWMGLDISNTSAHSLLGNFYTDTCSPLYAPPFSEVSGIDGPSTDCSGKAVGPIGTECFVRCKPGYAYREIVGDTTKVVCNKSKIWEFEATDSVASLTCAPYCPPMDIPYGRMNGSKECTSGRAFFNDTCNFNCTEDLNLIGSANSICGINGEWSHPPPLCTRICNQTVPPLHNLTTPVEVQAVSLDCSYEDVPYSDLILAGKICHYACEPPYVANSPLSIECLHSGLFSRALPTCEIPQTSQRYRDALCDEPPPHPQSVGKFIGKGVCVIARLTRYCAWYSCDPGYTFTSANYVHCSAGTYAWQTPPLCKRSCPNIGQCYNFTEGKTCLISCNRSQTLSHGNNKVTCQSDGTWSDKIPTCENKFQFQIAVHVKKENTTELYCMYHQERIVVYPYIKLVECSNITIFDSNSLWSWEGPYLLRHTGSAYCLSTDGIKHGSRLILEECNRLNARQQWKGSYHAKIPYMMVLKCNGDYLWAASSFIPADPMDEVRLVHYSILPTSYNDNDNSTEYAWLAVHQNDSMDFSNTLYTARGYQSLCPPLAAAMPVGGIMSNSCLNMQAKSGEVCYFDCKDGYARNLSSATYTVCLRNGIWSIVSFQCAVACPSLTNPKNGGFACACGCNQDSSARFLEGEICTLSCDTGFEAFGQAKLHCQHDGRWSGSPENLPICGKRCSRLALPPHSVVKPVICMDKKKNLVPETTCVYECLEGYKMVMPTSDFVTSAARTCFLNGTWSGSVVTCGRICPPLENSDNGEFAPVTCTTAESVSGFECTLECKYGFTVHGKAKRICEEDGNWKNSVTDDFGPPCRSTCYTLPATPFVESWCTLNGNNVSSEKPLSGTICKSLCQRGYGFASGSTVSRHCQHNRQWSGTDPDCVKEDQFVIFQIRESAATSNTHICLVSNENGDVKKIDYLHCQRSFNPYHLWAWHELWYLKNAGTGRCLAARTSTLSEQVVTVPCGDDSFKRMWSCDGFLEDGGSMFLRMAGSYFYPDYGAAHSDKVYLHDARNLNPDVDFVHWYARRLDPDGIVPLKNALPATICSNRGVFGVCPALRNPIFGTVHPEKCHRSERHIEVNMKCSFECDVGYRLMGGEQTSVCNPNGLWSVRVPRCLRICPLLDHIENGLVFPETCIDPNSHIKVSKSDLKIGILSGESCLFECDDGWRLSDGPAVLTCLGNGMWNAQQPKCKKICWRLTKLEHASAADPSCLTTDMVQGDACAFNCDSGYGVPKASNDCGMNSVLLATSRSGDQFCEKPQDFANESSISGRNYDETVYLTCTSNGTWTGDYFSCFMLCGSLPYPEHGFVSPKDCGDQDQAAGTTCTYECEKGYAIRGVNSRFTCVGGVWIPTSKVAERGFNATAYADKSYRMEIPACDKYCLSLTRVLQDHSMVYPPSCTYERIAVGTVCEVQCYSGYILRGNGAARCKDDGSWDSVLGPCVRRCRALKPPLNGMVSPYRCSQAAVGDGDTCVFACQDKYALIGEAALYCNGTGNWSFEEPTCSRRCPALPIIFNAKHQVNDVCYSEHIVALDKCKYECNAGYQLVGLPILVCLETGQWNGPVPGCHRICPLTLKEKGVVTCMVRGKQLYQKELLIEPPTWGSTCVLLCQERFAPTHSAYFMCGNDGKWIPAVPDCVEIEVPMFISQRIGSRRVCLIEDEIRRVVKQVEMEECVDPGDPQYSTAASWRWAAQHHIQNAKSGRCLSVRALLEGEIVRTEICDLNDPRQLWECSVHHPFRLTMVGTNLAPTTYYRELEVLILQQWNDVHSYFSTFDITTLSHSSVCSRRFQGKCPPLTDIKYGVVEPNDCKSQSIRVNQRCYYRCFPDTLVVKGRPFTICMSNGIWSNPPPVCSGFCTPLVNVKHGSYLSDPDCVFKASPVGKVCSVTCKRGYEAVGNVSVMCTNSKSWTPFDYQCLRTCPTIFGLLNGVIKPTPCTSGVCVFSCQAGYQLSGPDRLRCKTDGKWSDLLPMCLRDSQFRIILKSDSSFGDVCLTVRNHSQPLIKQLCSSLDIQDPTQLFKWLSDNERLFHPASGLCLTGSVYKWANVTLTTCVARHAPQLWSCGEVPGVDDYSLRLKSTYPSFFLDLGAALDYSSEIAPSSPLHNVVMEENCFISSQWFGIHHFAKGTVCSFKNAKQCPLLPLIHNGRVEPIECTQHNSITKGVICKVQCNSGYTIQQAEKSACQPDGTWALPLPSCAGVYRCDAMTLSDSLLQVNPSMCTGKWVPEGSWCYFSCPPDHHLLGEKYIICLKEGVWSDDPPTCRPQCRALRHIPFGSISPLRCYSSNSEPGTKCSVTCKEDYILLGSVNRTCRDDGSWSGEETICQGYCKSLPPLLNGIIFPDRCTDPRNENYHENTCSFRCNKGYLLIGVPFLTCYDGEWNDEMSHCIELAFCDRVVPGVNGLKEVFYRNLINKIAIGPGTEVTVECQLGYILNDYQSTRDCSSSGQWNGGFPVCLLSCDPLLPPNHGYFSPVSCSSRYQRPGQTCVVRCEETWVETGNTRITCGEDGKWMQAPPSCVQGVEVAGLTLQTPFMLRQYSAYLEIQTCMKLNPLNLDVDLSYDCGLVNEVPKSYLFRWRGYRGLIESAERPGYCLTPYFLNMTASYDEHYYVKLAIHPCNEDLEQQRFECGDVSLRQYALRLCAAGLWIGSYQGHFSKMTPITINMVKNGKYHMLSWQAYTIFEISRKGGLPGRYESTSMDTACNKICGEQHRRSSGAIASPGYPQPYPRNTICNWQIIVHDQVIRLWITDLDLEPGRDGGNDLCDRDHLLIAEGNDSKSDRSNVIATVCGAHLHTMGPYTSYIGNMWLTFYSDDIITFRRGFRASWLNEGFPAYLRDCHNTMRAEELKSKQEGRIVGGKPEERMKVPWQASLFDGGTLRWLCGAAIIKPSFVLTAAHCVEHIKTYDDLQQTVLAFGSSEIWRLARQVVHLRQQDMSISYSISNGGVRAYRIKDVFIHPNFDERLRNDIAILVLSSEIGFDDYVYPVCLPPSNVIEPALGKIGNIYTPQAYCKLAGWESETSTGSTRDVGEVIGNLVSIEIPIWSDRHCSFASSNMFGRSIDSNTFCAGHVDGQRQSACEGDDGGALVCVWNHNYYAVGITSQQLGDCSSLNAPRYFTRVASFSRWIELTILRVEGGLSSPLLYSKPHVAHVDDYFNE